jgi:hypothetical protein
MRLRLRRTSINSISQLHKEKEMADFRKWFLAFAVLALLLSGLAVPAAAQTTPTFQCQTNAGVPPLLRAEGLTELVGDVTLNCTGGVPTPAGVAVPQANFQIFLSTNVTSRLLNSSGLSEALLMVDEPHSAARPNTQLLACGDSGTVETFTGSGVCVVTGTGGGDTYSGDPADTGNADPEQGRPNVFQGTWTAAQPNSVSFLGVPIDPPGTSGTRVFRITNVRANANQLGVSATLVPTQVTMYITISSPTSVLVNNPQQTVGVVEPGLITSVHSAQQFTQCVGQNPSIATNPGSSSLENGSQFTVRFDEGFGTAWKPKNLAQMVANGLQNGGDTSVVYTYAGGTSYGSGDYNQNVPGAIYNTESGFENRSGQPDPPNSPSPTSQYFGRLSKAGVADSGTRLMINFASVPNGTQIFVPVIVPLVAQNSTGTVTGVAVLTATDANGAGSFTQVTATSGASVGSPAALGLAPVSISNQGGVAVYEVLFADQSALERMNVPIVVAYVPNLSANAPNGLPQPGITGTAAMGFAPVSNVGTASTSAPIPRFAPGSGPQNVYSINRCSCNILFPFVSNQLGFDTGIAISNTSLDPFGTGPQSGTVTINYYSAGTPPPAQTSQVVNAGDTLAFTLAGGGTHGITATPGFQGYIIAQAQFQYCHGFAYLSAFGQPYSGEGYLGIVLDLPLLNRTGQAGEVQAH